MVQPGGCLLLVLFSCLVALSFTYDATVIKDPTTGRFTVVSGIDPTGVAFGTFDDDLNATGWGKLRIQTNEKYDDNDQMYAAGYLEGSLTASHIYSTYLNLYALTFSSKPSPNLIKFLTQQDEWVRSKITSTHVPYWRQVSYIISQFDGLMAGYNARVPAGEQLPIFAFQFLNGIGDFFDLIPATDPSTQLDWFSLSPEEFHFNVFRRGHCSALVKLTADYSELFAGHSSWFEYGAMDRIFKQYDFHLSADWVAAKKMAFSSYPGFLESLDDFYMMDSGLVMVQTTNQIFNNSLYQYVRPQSLFAWQRVRLANSMASSGEQWSALFGLHNSGTYTNQYMVVDYKLFVPQQPLQNGTLWVVEQIPGLVVGADKTDVLQFGYWPSYNVAYFPLIYQLSGYPEAVKKYGTSASYQLAIRAKIFRRDQDRVVDLASFQSMLRYNDYKNDPFSQKNPSDSICARGDLGGYPGGCYDTKVTSSSLHRNNMTCWAINGPTLGNQLPPFSWSQFPLSPHLGLPEVFNFDFVRLSF